MVKGIPAWGERGRNPHTLAGSTPASSELSPRSLRAAWRDRSSVVGWTTPSDWAAPAVDAICEVIVGGGDVWPCAERLGAARAAAGVGLGEALADTDALAALVPQHYGEVLRRAVSLGWADRVVAPRNYVCDPLTGLSSLDYLNVRLGELYRGAEAAGEALDWSYALVVVRLELASHELWQRSLPLILVGESLRTVFDGGQTLARLSESTAVAVAERNVNLPRRVRLVSTLVQSQIAADPDIQAPATRVWTESCPTSYHSALDLVNELSR